MRNSFLSEVNNTSILRTEVQDLKDASGGRVSLTVCDMTKEESVKAWPPACPTPSAIPASIS